MGPTSNIEWTDASWNPFIGCRKVSPGCKNCYAERIENRYGDFSKIRETKTLLNPMTWAVGRRIFTCSMSDFFIEEADPWREKIWNVIRDTRRHTYQILTKRPERIKDHLPKDWGERGWPNVWLGTSVELPMYLSRVSVLVENPAPVHFISFEPLLGPIGPWNQPEVEWVITGGESDYHHPRPANPEWFNEIRKHAHAQGIAFFHKQNGGRRKCECHGTYGCRLIDGRTWDEFPKQ